MAAEMDGPGGTPEYKEGEGEGEEVYLNPCIHDCISPIINNLQGWPTAFRASHERLLGNLEVYLAQEVEQARMGLAVEHMQELAQRDLAFQALTEEFTKLKTEEARKTEEISHLSSENASLKDQLTELQDELSKLKSQTESKDVEMQEPTQSVEPSGSVSDTEHGLTLYQ